MSLMDGLQLKYDKLNINFLLAYVKEPHAGEWDYVNIEQPKEYEERLNLARETVKELSLKRQVVIDTLDNDLYMKYGGCPNSVYVIGPDGKIVYHNRWADHEDVDAFLQTII